MVTQVEPEPHADDTDTSPDPAELMRAATEIVTEQARQHPLRTIGIAFAAGYVLGGGVPRFVVRMATNAAMRSAGAAILASGIAAQLAARVLGGAAAPETPTPPEPKNGHARKRRAPRR
jgi:hypothetical protein